MASLPVLTPSDVTARSSITSKICENNNQNNNKNNEEENKLSNSHQMQQSLHNQSIASTSNGSLNQIIKTLSPSSNNSNSKPPIKMITENENRNTYKNLISGININNINNYSINSVVNNDTTVIYGKSNKNDHTESGSSQSRDTKSVNYSKEFNINHDKNLHDSSKNENNIEKLLNDIKMIGNSNCYDNNNKNNSIIFNNNNNNNNNKNNDTSTIDSNKSYSNINGNSNQNINNKKIDDNKDSIHKSNINTNGNRNDSNNNRNTVSYIDSNKNNVKINHNIKNINTDNNSNSNNKNKNCNNNNANKTGSKKTVNNNNDNHSNNINVNNKSNNNNNANANSINNDNNNSKSINNINNICSNSEKKPATIASKVNNITNLTIHNTGKNVSPSASPNDIRINISRQYNNILQSNNNINLKSDSSANINVHNNNKNNTGDNRDNGVNDASTSANNNTKKNSCLGNLDKKIEDECSNNNHLSNNLSDNNNNGSDINDSKNNIKISLKMLDNKRNKAVNIATSATSTAGKDAEIENAESRIILLINLNEHIICNLCQGYLIDATTIVECLHSFCHSCLMKHLRTEEYCPRCEMMINTAKPNIKSDTKLQAIVYKLVPDLYDKELKRKRAFYCDRPEEAKLATAEQRGEDTEHLIFSPSENMSISLEYADIEDLPNEDTYGLKTPTYLQCPAVFTIGHLKKFVYLKFGIDTELFCIEIMCKVKAIILCDHYKLMDIAYIYTWKREAPMRFFFRVKATESYGKIMRERRKVSTVFNIASQLYKQHTSIPKIEIKQEVICDTTKIQSPQNQTKVLKEMIKIKTEPIESASASSSFTNTSHKYSSSHSLSISREFKIVPSPKSPNDSKTDKLKITLVDKNKILSPNFERNMEKPSSNHHHKKHLKLNMHSPPTEREKRKQENIKMKIDISKQDSIKIINMSGPDRDVVPKEIVKPVKPEWKIKIKKEILSPKTSPTDKKSNKSLSPLSVPPLTIKAEKLSPNYLNPKYNNKEENQLKLETEEIIEEIKKSEFLNSFALQPIKNLSPEKQQKLIIEDKLNDKTIKDHNLITNNKFLSLMGPPPPMKPTASKRKLKEPFKTVSKKSKMTSVMNKSKLKKTETNTLKEMISFKLAPFPIGGISDNRQSVDTNSKIQLTKSPETVKTLDSINTTQKKEIIISQKQSEDIKLMPAPPTLETLDALKKISLKPMKSKLSIGKKKSEIAPPGSLTPRPGMISAGIGSIISSKNVNSASFSCASGNRTPTTTKRYPPILPKELRPNPFATIPSDVNKMLKNSGTEIRTVSENNPVKVYGPALSKSKTSPVKASMAPTSQNSAKKPPQNYLNYALFNASKQRHGDQAAPPGCRTPMYTPNSPIYSPSSPQYMSGYSIPIQPTYKYTPKTAAPQSKPNAGTNYLQNVFGSQSSQLAGLFPGPPVKSEESKTSSSLPNNFLDDKKSTEAIKRPFPYCQSSSPPINGDIKMTLEEPVEKQMKVKTLLNSCNINIPSSLSITITSDEGESRANNLLNSKHKSPVNNYIEILKLPPEEQNEMSIISASDKIQKTSVKTISTSSGSPMVATIVSTVNSSRCSPLLLHSIPLQIKTAKSSPKQSIQTKVTNNKSPTENGKIQELNKRPCSTPPPSQTTKSPKSVSKSPTNKKISVSPEKQKNHNLDKLKFDKKEESKKSPPKNNENLVGKPFMKKFRHILPRATTPPQQQNQPQAGVKSSKNINVPSTNNNTSPSKNKQLNSQTSNFGIVRPGNLISQTENSKTDIRSSSNADNIKSPQQSPPLPINGQISLSHTVSPQMPQASDVANFLNERMLRQQAAVAAAHQQSNTQTHNMLFPHLAAQFGHHQFPTINYGYNFQQAFMLEQISRMQKEAIEKYKLLKFSPNNNKTSNVINNGNNGTKSGPSSPSNNTNISMNNTNNVIFSMQKDATKS